MPNVVFPMVALAFASGCNLLSGKCTYELRSLEATGSVEQGGAPLAAALLNLSEQRGSVQGQSIHWLVTGDALKGTGANLAGFHDLLGAGRGVIELKTYLGSQPTVQIPVIVTNSSDWIRPRCS